MGRGGDYDGEIGRGRQHDSSYVLSLIRHENELEGFDNDS